MPAVPADDPRRRIPRTDHLLGLPEVQAAAGSMSRGVVASLVRAVQDRARQGQIPPEQVEPELLATLAARAPASLRPVLNATGVIVHTNLGRAPLSEAARRALLDAAGYADVEFDLATGARSRRGVGARAALLAACPGAQDALVVNNGAAALVLATTALAAPGPTSDRPREVIVARGELIEIGAGFRLPDLIASTGARLREVGTTNRTHLADYAEAIGPNTACVLKIHASNYRITGFTAEASIAELHGLCADAGIPLLADLGSGLLRPDPTLPDEPDLETALRAGADAVIASGDKLLGGPQAGLLLGTTELIARLSRHPLARAVRADKLALAALEATLSGADAPVARFLHTDAPALRARTEAFAARAGLGADAVVAHDGRVGGGGGAEVPLPGWALALPEQLAGALRIGSPAVVATVRDGACLIDLRCIEESDEDTLLGAIEAARDAVSRDAS